MKLHTEKTTLKQMQDFLEHARPLDIQEAEMDGIKFTDLPLSDFEDCKSIVDEEGNVFAIGGVVKEDTDIGAVWMLCTKRVEQHKITFLRFTKRLLEDYLKRYAVLGNRAWLGNQLHIDRLTWMGAKWANCEGEFRWFGFVRKETPE